MNQFERIEQVYIGVDILSDLREGYDNEYSRDLWDKLWDHRDITSQAHIMQNTLKEDINESS